MTPLLGCRRIKKSFTTLMLILATLLCLTSEPILAQAPGPNPPGIGGALPDDNALDKIINEYRTKSSQWSAPLARITSRIFWSLALIDTVVFVGFMIIGRFDASDLIGDMVRRITMYGFYLFLIRDSGSLPKIIVESFQVAAKHASGTNPSTANLGPSDIFDAGIDLVARLWDNFSVLHMIDGMMSLLCGLIILFCFVIIAANVLIATIEMWIAVNAGIILLGFGGARWTRDIANRYMFYLLSVGIKLFSMQLLVGLGQTFILSWATVYQKTLMDNIVMVACSLAMVLLVNSVPEIMAGVLNGVSASPNQLNAARAASMAAGAAVGFAGAAVGAGMAANQAYQIAKDSPQGGQGAKWKATKLAAKAAVEDFKAKHAGQYGHSHSSLGGRMAGIMRKDWESGVRKENSNSNDSGSKSQIPSRSSTDEASRKANVIDEEERNKDD